MKAKGLILLTAISMILVSCGCSRHVSRSSSSDNPPVESSITPNPPVESSSNIPDSTTPPVSSSSEEPITSSEQKAIPLLGKTTMIVF